MNELRAIVFAVWASISQAATAVGIDRHRMSRLLDGKTDIYGWEAAVIADAAGVTVADVIAAAQSVRQRAGPSEKEKSPRKYCSTSGGRQ